MAVDETNGQPPEVKPIQIVISLAPSAGGFLMRVDYPQDVYADTIIDGCLRAARYMEQQALIHALAEHGAKAMQMQRELGQIRHRLS